MRVMRDDEKDAFVDAPLFGHAGSEFDPDSLNQREIAPADTQADWPGPLHDVAPDETGSTEKSVHSARMNGPADAMEPEV